METGLHACELTKVGDKIVLILSQFDGTFALGVAKEIKFTNGSNGMGGLRFVEIVLVNGGGVESTDESGATSITFLPLTCLGRCRGSGVWRWRIR